MFDFDMMTALAVSRLRLNVTEFFELSPREFFIALVDQQEREAMRTEAVVRAVWESARLQMLIEVNKRAKSQIKDPCKLFALPWDERFTGEQRIQDPEVLKKVMMWEAGKAERRRTKKKVKRWKKSVNDISARK